MTSKLSITAPLTAIALATFYETFKDELKHEGRQVKATIRDANKEYVRPFLDNVIDVTNKTRYTVPPIGHQAVINLGANALHYAARAMRYVNTDRILPHPSVSVKHSYGSRSYGSRSYGYGSFHRSPFSSRYFKRKTRKYKKKKSKKTKSRRRKRSR